MLKERFAKKSEATHCSVRPNGTKTARNAAGAKGARGADLPWARWSDERLLDLRMKDLGVRIEGSWLEEVIGQLHAELAERRLRVKPHCWLSEEWFSPEGVPGIALPFFLAHPRLMRLERSQMYEVEGGTRRECMKLLRHEAGHAMQHAFDLHRRRRWQNLFGKSSEPYPEFYRPNPASKRFVLHLDLWYAQSHPDEDFAETFAVWLSTPEPRWRKRYAGWPALDKLEYVDELMAELAGKAAKVRCRERTHPLGRITKTLREYYAEKRERFTPQYSVYDQDLARLFRPAEEVGTAGEPAAQFLKRNKARVRRVVSRWSGEYQFTLDMIMAEMSSRCRELDLRAVGDEHELQLQFSVLLTALTAHQLYRARDWYPM